MTAEYFDQWYADMAGSGDRSELKRRHLGLPPELESTSLLTFGALQEIRDRLDLSPADVLLDLACGRGGYGLWLARETGCRLIGVDFSAVALQQARETARSLGQSARTEFRVGDLVATGLADGSVDAVICIDAIQFASDLATAAAEIRRVLAPGQPVIATCWEPLNPDDSLLSERLRSVDLSRQLPAGGLVDVVVVERADWRSAEHALWTEAAALEPGDDRALQSLHAEALRVLPTLDRIRRVFATAQAP
ncbi:MAG TPA: class I SAM-dependent methyltransferase [Mycobacteriales bacterium]|nr:class I SAM-dependent methyltransferase [Mycobacteriales bacterium]